MHSPNLGEANTGFRIPPTFVIHAGSEALPKDACLHGFGSTPKSGYAALANPRPFSDGAPHAWETSQQLHMVEQRATKARSSLIVIFGNMTDDAGEVV